MEASNLYTHVPLVGLVILVPDRELVREENIRVSKQGKKYRVGLSCFGSKGPRVYEDGHQFGGAISGLA